MLQSEAKLNNRIDKLTNTIINQQKEIDALQKEVKIISDSFDKVLNFCVALQEIIDFVTKKNPKPNDQQTIQSLDEEW